MLETLTSLKSAKKEPNRFLSSLGKKRRRASLSESPISEILLTSTDVPVLTHEPLRVSLDDLLQSDTRGKWWLVGAGWQGNPLLEVKPVERERNDDSLIELAREQGMNTDVRRSIFVILMTSEVRPSSLPTSWTNEITSRALPTRLFILPVLWTDADYSTGLRPRL